MAEIGTDINKANLLLQQGELVAIPTETVYGLAGNAINIEAVTKIFEVKGRPQFDPLIVHVPNITAISHYALDIPEKAQLLAESFWPGPLTLLLKKRSVIPDLVTSGLETVGVRCPDHVLSRSLLESISFPLAAPSANPFGYVSPTSPQHVNDQLGDKIKYILDGGVCTVGIESTIVGFENDEVIIHRLGGLNIDDIKKIVGEVSIQTHSTSNPKAPGQLISHYAPRKKVVLGNIGELLKNYPKERTGVLSFQHDYQVPFQFVLSPKGTTSEAAQNLFSALRTLDKLPIDVIVGELVPNEGLGAAVNDRLIRAAAQA